MSLLNRIESLELKIELGDCSDVVYWDLGFNYLLAGREEDAQSTWFVPFINDEESDEENLTADLVSFLSMQASEFAISDLDRELLIRQHIQNIDPGKTLNVLALIVVAAKLNLLSSELLAEWQALDLQYCEDIDILLIENVLAALTTQYTTVAIKLIRLYLGWINIDRYPTISKLVNFGFLVFHKENKGNYAVEMLEICQEYYPDSLEVLQVLASLYSVVDRHQEAVEIAKHCVDLAKDDFEKLFTGYVLQKAYFMAGDWVDAESRHQHHQKLVRKIVDLPIDRLPPLFNSSLISSSFFGFYVEDNPRSNRPLQNELAKLYQRNVFPPSILETQPEVDELPKKPGVIRIGYLASTLREHSVGWLSRWLIHYHDREKFQIFCYCINQSPNNAFNHKWFRDKTDVSYYFGIDPLGVVNQIKHDQIDILIELDSLTLDLTCLIVSQKPAPVQVSWLGFDATGLPAIDYFIADPYVLPDDAQDYYQEKIWRLPSTYLAVDGFEVGIPTLRRKDLDIPDDAIVYFSSQTGSKRNPDNVRAQMKIIAAVPNSYFLVKGKSDRSVIEGFFGQIAVEEGVSLDRLKFLDIVVDEPTHRANLAIADVVLDTYPYNGATTTLETLWMGIPIVTQVGEQFAARNSYTFMLNAGIEEVGIAWNQQEYIEWGVKLGLDRTLRTSIREKLRLGRSSSPVWNAKQFTIEMEQAYIKMWSNYVAKI